MGSDARSSAGDSTLSDESRSNSTQCRSALDIALAPPRAVIGTVQNTSRHLEKMLARRAPARAMLAVPRTANFIGSTAVRRVIGGGPDTPVPSITPALAAQVAMDETILALVMGPNRFPNRADYERVGAELAYARLLFETEGWLDDPASYHRQPPPLSDPVITRGWALGQSYERLLFQSEFSPRPEEPGADRWNSYHQNRTASATVLRHPGEPRPWVVAIHGFATGYPFMDFIGMHARYLHQELGLNVVLPVLPLHGPRKITRISGEAFLSFDLVNTVHGLTQAVWDVRRVLSWLTTQEPTAVALYGVSLGGYIASLLTGLVDGIDAVVAGIPVVDFPQLFTHQSPHHVRLRAVEHEILDGNAEAVHRVVSPLEFPARVPSGRRFIYAGLGDRMVPTPQPHALWKHWDEPEILWYPGNHVGYLWSRQVTSFLRHCLEVSGMVTPDGAGEDWEATVAGAAR